MSAHGKFGSKRGDPVQWSPTLITSDFAKILGISKRQSLKAVTWCVERGFIERRGAAAPSSPAEAGQ